VGELHGADVERGERRFRRGPSVDAPAGVHGQEVAERVVVASPWWPDASGRQRVGAPLARARAVHVRAHPRSPPVLSRQSTRNAPVAAAVVRLEIRAVVRADKRARQINAVTYARTCRTAPRAAHRPMNAARFLTSRFAPPAAPDTCLMHSRS
jgi:hypothetical protein